MAADKFDYLVKIVRKKLVLIDPVVRTVVYNTMYDNNLEIRGTFNAELRKAISRKYIDELDEKDFEEIADVEFDCSDLDFWTDHLKIKLDYIS